MAATGNIKDYTRSCLPLVSLSQKGREIQNMTVFEKVLSTRHRFVS